MPAAAAAASSAATTSISTRAPGVGVVRRRVEAARAAERAALQPHDEPRARAVGAAARLDRVDRATITCRACGTTGSGRSPDALPTDVELLEQQIGRDDALSMPPDGTKPSSVPPVSRSCELALGRGEEVVDRGARSTRRSRPSTRGSAPRRAARRARAPPCRPGYTLYASIAGGGSCWSVDLIICDQLAARELGRAGDRGVVEPADHEAVLEALGRAPRRPACCSSALRDSPPVADDEQVGRAAVERAAVGGAPRVAVRDLALRATACGWSAAS